ncbi:UNVERIFIED_CONTAM: protein IQ-DOMAIN 1 [Sesamum calycinum]|uniref:Protein IQ-DOMAIN 1 n=1 Tax=Sesamum calycinum TaxID=2727403 RepID=A0AAW2PNI6_9LAMI
MFQSLLKFGTMEKCSPDKDSHYSYLYRVLKLFIRVHMIMSHDKDKLRNDKKMGRKGSWFSTVKKAFSSDSKAKKAKKAKKKWFGKEKPSVSDSPKWETVEESHPHPLPPLEDVKMAAVENEQTKQAYSVAVATAVAAEAAVAAAQAPTEVVRVTTVNQFAGKSRDEVAAIKIQTAFRGYLYCMTSHAAISFEAKLQNDIANKGSKEGIASSKRLVRLKSLVDGPTVKRQTANTLKCMQTLSRVQAQIQSRRIRMSEENRALQRQLLQKRAKELESLRMGEEWDDSLQSKEQIEANLLHKYEAAMRRERALAYSYTHQQTWKKSAKSTNLLFMDPTNPHWGWSWLERWMAARSWESQNTEDHKDPNSDRLSSKSAMGTGGGEITKSFARHQLNSDTPSPGTQKPPSHQSPSTPSKAASSVAARKLKPASPRGSVVSQDDESGSIFSVQSERNRRHSIASSSVRDDESLASSPSVPSYMAPTKSAKAKSRLPSPLGMENGSNTPEKGSVGRPRNGFLIPLHLLGPGGILDPPRLTLAPSPTMI